MLIDDFRLFPGANAYIKKEQAKVRYFPLIARASSLLGKGSGTDILYVISVFNNSIHVSAEAHVSNTL